MASGIYRIINSINGKIYIGSAVNIDKRWRDHISLLKKGRHHSRYLQNAWNKYGAYAFEFSIIEECDIPSLIAREQYFIDTLSPDYNVCKVAGSSLGVKRSDETRAKIGFVSRNISAETRAKIGAANKARKISSETRAKISARQVGKTYSAETRAKMSAANKGQIPWNKGKKANP